jgi:hypothetical protein
MLRPSTIFLATFSFGCTVLLALLVHAQWRQVAELPQLRNLAKLAADLRLTDLVLCTEARYTRHPSQADRHAAFQEHPGALEHFPTGSLLTVTNHIR